MTRNHRSEESKKLEEIRRIVSRDPSRTAKLLKNWLSQRNEKGERKW